MLKSYKQLSRWYGALEPEKDAPEPEEPGRTEAGMSAADDDTVPPARALRDGDDTVSPVPAVRDGDDTVPPARAPRDDDERWQRPPEDVPADLPAKRSEFTGGWSDWVAGRAPGPDDEYTAPSDSGVTRFPWPDDDAPAEPPPRPPVSRALRQAAREHPAVRRARLLLVLIAAVVLVVAVAACALLLLRASGTRAAAPKESLGPASVRFAAGSVRAGSGAGGACPTERSEAIVRSAESGGTDSGPDAVLAFQHAYYVERSGERAREVVAPDAAVQPAAVIQQGIDTVPAGTEHCVRIVTVGDNRYSVEVTEYRPGGVPATYNRQTVTTAVIGGRTLITGIAAG